MTTPDSPAEHGEAGGEMPEEPSLVRVLRRRSQGSIERELGRLSRLDVCEIISHIDALRSHIEVLQTKLRALEEGRWIAVGERLPETPYGHGNIRTSDDVLVVWPDCGIGVACFTTPDEWHDHENNSISKVAPTHWQPLPSAPKAPRGET